MTTGKKGEKGFVKDTAIPELYKKLWQTGRDDIDTFVRRFGSPPDKKYFPLDHQKKFIDSMVSGEFDEGWMSGGNSAGKTWTGKWMAMQWASHKIKPGKPWKSYKEYQEAPYNILCTGPEQKQSIELWEAIEEGFLHSPMLRMRVEEIRTGTRRKTHPYIKLKNGVIIEAVGLHEKGKHVEGQAYDLVLVNEPADVRSLIHCLTRVLNPRTWRRGGVIAGFGTPKGKGEYYQVFRAGIEEGKNPFFKDRVFSMYADSRENVFANQTKIKRFLSTQNPDLITERIEGKFIDETSLAFPFSQIESAIDDELPHPIKPSKGRFYITGVDFGRKVDYTVAHTLDITGGVPPFTLVNHMRMGGGVVTWEEILGELLNIHEDYRGIFIVDSTASAGDIQTEWLTDMNINFIPYQFAGSPAKKSNLITALQRALGLGHLRMPYLNDIVEELHTYPKNMQDKDMETDCVFALALAVYGANMYGPAGEVEGYRR